MTWLDYRTATADPAGLADLVHGIGPWCERWWFMPAGPGVRLSLLISADGVDEVERRVERCFGAVTRVPRDDRAAVLGGPGGVALFDAFHHGSSRASLTTLTSDGDRSAVAVAAMVQGALRFPGPLRLGGMSFRSHVEGALMEAPAPARARARLERLGAAWEGGVESLVGAVLADPGEDLALPGLREFCDVVDGMLPWARRLLVRGEVRLPLHGRDGRTAWAPELLARSAFHEALQTDARWQAAARSDPVVRLHRVLVNWVHLHLARLGLTRTQRLALCWLVADAVDRRPNVEMRLSPHAPDLARRVTGTAALRYARRNRTGAHIPERVDWARLPGERPGEGRRLHPLPSGEPFGDLVRLVNGISRVRWDAEARRDGNRFLGPVHRVVSSAGQRYPAELHVMGGPGGAGRYEPNLHALAAPQDAPPSAEEALVVGVTPWRTRFKYGEFAYRLQCMDAGTLIGQALAVRDFHVRYYFDDDAVDLAIGVLGQGTYGCAVLEPREPLGHPCRDGTGLPVPPAPGRTPFPVGNAPGGDPDSGTAVERSARRTRRRPDPSIPPLNERLSAGVSEWVELPEYAPRADRPHLRRSCMGLFGPGRLQAEEAAYVLGRTAAPYSCDVPGGVAFAQTALVAAVGEVEGVRPGVYLVTGGGRRLGALRHGDVRGDLQRAVTRTVLDVERAPLTLTVLTDYEAALPVYGDRWYRVQGMEAGIAVQRCYLACAAAGLACQAHCGFDPDTVLRLLELADQHLDPMIQILVGRDRPTGLTYEMPVL
ncbi:hypothetical protein GWI34_00945 [Actinomadura sp. DSM 109109]|nr:hypothetical protein [Actinomadura lepetitiana]